MARRYIVIKNSNTGSTTVALPGDKRINSEMWSTVSEHTSRDAAMKARTKADPNAARVDAIKAQSNSSTHPSTSAKKLKPSESPDGRTQPSRDRGATDPKSPSVSNNAKQRLQDREAARAKRAKLKAKSNVRGDDYVGATAARRGKPVGTQTGSRTSSLGSNAPGTGAGKAVDSKMQKKEKATAKKLKEANAPKSRNKEERLAFKAANKGFSFENEKSRTRIDKKGMSKGESIFASFLVGGGVGGGIVNAIIKTAKIGGVIDWFNGLKKKPSLDTVTKKIKKETGKQVKLPKPKIKPAATKPPQLKGPSKSQLPAVTKPKPPVVTKPAPKQINLPSLKKPIKTYPFGRTAAATAAIHGGPSDSKAAEPPIPKHRPAGKKTKINQAETANKQQEGLSVEKPLKITKINQRPQKTDTRQEGLSAEEDTRDALTKKMEKLLGLNRSSTQIRKDLAATKKLDKDLLYRGGKVKSRSKVSRGNTSASKKYTMNRGGKVASVRKPTRA